MFLRQLRWIAAGVAVVAAVCASPARSKADIQILVEELGSGAPATGFSFGTPVGPFFSQPFSYTAPGGHYTVSGAVGTNSASGSFNASLSTSFNVGITDAYTAAGGRQLRVTVTDDRFSSNGFQATLTNGVAIPLEVPGAVLESNAFSRIYNPTADVTQAGSGTQLAGQLVLNPNVGAPNLAQTDVATDERPRTDPDESTSPPVGIASLPSPYAVQQVIIVSVTGPESIRGQTFTVNATSQVQSTTPPPAVPAPGGLVLALIALPLVGLRRKLRGRAAA